MRFCFEVHYSQFSFIQAYICINHFYYSDSNLHEHQGFISNAHEEGCSCVGSTGSYSPLLQGFQLIKVKESAQLLMPVIHQIRKKIHFSSVYGDRHNRCLWPVQSLSAGHTSMMNTEMALQIPLLWKMNYSSELLMQWKFVWNTVLCMWFN